MKIWKPAYYDTFHCIGGSCPDSCCRLWDVQVDPDSVKKYQSIPGEFGDRVRAALMEDDGEMIIRQKNGSCPLWREDGLCDLQVQMGEQALCDVCREFPRIRHEYGSFTELGLEMSCPEAARIMLTTELSDGIVTEADGGEEPEYDQKDMDILLESRKTALDFLKNSSYSVGETLAILMLYGYEVQNWLDGGEKAELNPEVNLADAKELAQDGNLQNILKFYGNLEILTPEWQQRLQNPEKHARWNSMHPALARYLVQRYWLQAVSDFDLAGRVKFIVVSCLVVKALGGNTIDTAHLYSKEIENDADNMDAFLDGAYEDSALADRGVLSLLLR